MIGLIIVLIAVFIAGFSAVRWYVGLERQILYAVESGNYTTAANILSNNWIVGHSNKLVRTLSRKIDDLEAGYEKGELEYEYIQTELNSIEQLGILGISRRLNMVQKDTYELHRIRTEENTDWNEVEVAIEESMEATEIETTVPTEPETLVLGNQTIAAGRRHSVVMFSDGTAISSGNNESGQCNVYGWTNLVAVAAGDHHTVGLKKNGTVVATGQNKYGQCDVSGWTDVIQISAGDYHTIALLEDGSLLATGWNTYQQCSVSKIYDAVGRKKIIEVAAGYEHTVVLCEDGTVAAVGRNDFGQCNVGGWTDIVAIYAGTEHTVGLRSDGTVLAVGRNKEGQCNVSGWRNVEYLTAGDYFIVGITSGGELLYTGQNNHGQLDLSRWNDVIAVGGGSEHTVAITKDGDILAAGWNDDSQCAIAGYSYFATRDSVDADSDVKYDLRAYIPVVEQAISEERYLPQSNGMLYDLDNDGIQELVMLHEKAEMEGDTIIGECHVCSVFDIENGVVTAKIDEKYLTSMAGAPESYVGIVEYKGSTMFLVHASNGHVIGEKGLWVTTNVLYDPVTFREVLNQETDKYNAVIDGIRYIDMIDDGYGSMEEYMISGMPLDELLTYLKNS